MGTLRHLFVSENRQLFPKENLSSRHLEFQVAALYYDKTSVPLPLRPALLTCKETKRLLCALTMHRSV